MPDTDHLREAALAATPGPWTKEHGFTEKEPYLIESGHKALGPFATTGWVIASIHEPWERGVNGPPRTRGAAENAAYIALASPDRVLALLDEVALLRAALDMIAHPVAHGYPDPQDRAALAHWMTRVARLALSGAEMDRLALVAGSGR